MQASKHYLDGGKIGDFNASQDKRGGYLIYCLFFVGFNPAVSDEAAKSMREAMRQWRLHRQTDKSLDELAQMINPVVRGWITYYGNFYKSALYPTFQCLNNILVRWDTRRYKRLRGHNRRAHYWLQRIVHKQPQLFAHWGLPSFKAGQ